MEILNPLTNKKEDIPAVLNSLAAQENCDGEPYDQMVEAATYIKKLEHVIAEIKPYLIAAEAGSMSRNNSEALAGELLEKIAEVYP